MAGFIHEDSRDQSWSPEVDVNRLRQMARGGLNTDAERAMYRLIRTFGLWNDAFVDVLAEEYHARVANMTRWERFRYRTGNYMMAVRAFFLARVWNLFPSLDPANRPDPVDEWMRREIERDLNEADGVKQCRKH